MNGKQSSRMSAGLGIEHRAFKWIAAGVVFVLVFAVFWPALSYGFVDWDDRDNFLRNNNFRGVSKNNLMWMFSTFHMGHYQPLTWLSHGLNAEIARRMYGDPLDPRPYHFTNNLMHAVNAVLFYFVTHRLIHAAARPTTRVAGTRTVKGRAVADTSEGQPAPTWSSQSMILAAAFAALFFGIHPLRVESVAWITERRDLLSGMFLLLTLLAYLRAVGSPQQSTKWMLITLGLFLLSMLSKVIGATLPIVLLILDWYPLKRIPSSPRQWSSPACRRVFIEKAPFFVISVTFALVASIGQGRNNWLAPWWLHPLDGRIVQSFYGLMFYAWKTVAPTRLLPIYEAIFPLDIRQWKFVIATAVVVVASIVIVLLRRRYPALLAAALIYAVILGPVLGIMQNGTQLVADRYSYLPCMGWAVLAGVGLVILAVSHRRLIIPAVALGVSWLGVQGVLTIRQIGIWQDTESLWKCVALNDPDNSLGLHSYGFVLLEKGQIDEAIDLFRQAVDIRPENEQAHRNLMTAMIRKGDRAGLAKACDRAIENGTKWNQRSLVGRAHFLKADLHRTDGQFPLAEIEYRAALNADPTMLEAGTDLGFVLGELGRLNEAIDEYKRVLGINPNHFTARLNLGITLSQAGQREAAIENLRLALRLQPGHPVARAALDRLLGASK